VLVIESRLLTGKVNIWLTELSASFTVTMNVTGPAVCGVPLRVPLLARVSQDGKPMAEKVYVPVPPVAMNVSV
jgi:hypothetical protein